MRSLYGRRLFALVIVVALASHAVARPKEDRPPKDPRDAREAVVRFVKRIVRALGDGLTTPTP
jgi:hypothetical protein